MRRRLIRIFMIAVFIVVVFKYPTEILNDYYLYNYYLENTFQETGATNIVTGIYLNYRVFDTIFESLLLLVSVIAIIYFSSHEGEY